VSQAAVLEGPASDDRALLRETTARFMRDYGSLERVRRLQQGEFCFDAEAWRQGVDLGWTSLLVPEADGGGSVTSEPLLDLVGIVEELGKVLHSSPVLPTNLVAFAIAESGSDALRQEYLPGFVSGQAIGAWCSSGVVPDDGDVEAVPDGNGFVLNGIARFVQDGAKAGVYLVTARTADGGITQFIMRRDVPGVTSTPKICFDFSRQVSEVRFEGARIAHSAVLGRPGQGAADAAGQLALALVLQCADSVGALGRVNDMTFDWAKERYAFGRPIGSFQGIKYKCVEMYLDHLGSRAVLAAAAEAVQARSAQALTLARIAKAHVGDAFTRCVKHCHQIHGGISFTWEHDAHLYLRRSAFNAAMYGTPDWQRDCLAQELGI
jgi:alkylation response protein AidB-like acyl-CoA dehydrogenase